MNKNYQAIPFKDYEIINNEIQLIKLVEKLKKTPVLIFDLEINNINCTTTNLVGLSFIIEHRIATCIPILNNYLNISNELTCVRVIELIKPIFEDKKISKIGHNLKFKSNILKKYNIDMCGALFDTMIESYVIRSTLCHNDIEVLSDYWLNNKISFFQKVSNIANSQISICNKFYYLFKRINIIFQLHLKLWSEIQKHTDLLNIFQSIDMPLMSVLSRIERNGVKIDPIMLHNQSKEIKQKLFNLEQKAYKIAGEHFNLSSIKEVRKILLKNEEIKLIKKKRNETFSTSEKNLENLSRNFSLPRIILEYRKLAKIKSNYTDILPKMIDPKTGRLHTTYNQTVVATGRLSSTNPNLQNIPVRKEEGRRVRQAFIAQKDYVIISADYSQIELRIMAHSSCDEELLNIFNKGEDIHCTTAKEIFNKPVESITMEQRHCAKIINFSLIYGISAFGLSHQLNISLKESRKYIDLYFKRYPGVLNYMKFIRNEAKEKGYVKTIDGRRVYIPHIKSSNKKLRSCAERSAINATIQGTAADIIKKAMIDIDNWLKKEQLRILMIMQVHDELVFESHKEDIKIASKKIKEIMENCGKLNVPLPINIGFGKSWNQAR